MNSIQTGNEPSPNNSVKVKRTYINPVEKISNLAPYNHMEPPTAPSQTTSQPKKTFRVHPSKMIQKQLQRVSYNRPRTMSINNNKMSNGFIREMNVPTPQYSVRARTNSVASRAPSHNSQRAPSHNSQRAPSHNTFQPPSAPAPLFSSRAPSQHTPVSMTSPQSSTQETTNLYNAINVFFDQIRQDIQQMKTEIKKNQEMNLLKPSPLNNNNNINSDMKISNLESKISNIEEKLKTLQHTITTNTKTNTNTNNINHSDEINQMKLDYKLLHSTISSLHSQLNKVLNDKVNNNNNIDNNIDNNNIKNEQKQCQEAISSLKSQVINNINTYDKLKNEQKQCKEAISLLKSQVDNQMKNEKQQLNSTDPNNMIDFYLNKLKTEYETKFSTIDFNINKLKTEHEMRFSTIDFKLNNIVSECMNIQKNMKNNTDIVNDLKMTCDNLKMIYNDLKQKNEKDSGVL